MGDGDELKCNYLCIGAGTSTMSFVDTMLSSTDKSITFIIVDKKPAAGGHWNVAYPFVTLHQPSGAYGVASEPLGKVKNGREVLDPDDLATGAEVMTYYERVMAKFVATGRVRFFPTATYDWESATFVDAGGRRRAVAYDKLVTPESGVVVPSMRPPPFPVEAGNATVKPVNALPTTEADHYVVIGAGKTAFDAMLHLLGRGVDQRHVTWIVPHDMWINLRDKFWEGGTLLPAFLAMLNALLRQDSVLCAFKELEASGYVGRLDQTIEPQLFKGATVSTAELRMLHTVQNVVRLGRVTAVRADFLELEKGTLPLAPGTLLVDCASEGVGGLRADFDVFAPAHIKLSAALSTANFSHSAALIAHVEATYTDDATKNGFMPHSAAAPLGIAKGGSPFFKGELGQFVQMLYADIKTTTLLGAHMRSAAFNLTTRTNYGASCHCSLLKTLWGLYGPDQLDKKLGRLMRKIEQGGFAESPPMPEHAPPPSGRKNYGLGALAPLLLPLLELVGLFLSLSLSS